MGRGVDGGRRQGDGGRGRGEVVTDAIARCRFTDLGAQVVFEVAPTADLLRDRHQRYRQRATCVMDDNNNIYFMQLQNIDQTNDTHTSTTQLIKELIGKTEKLSFSLRSESRDRIRRTDLLTMSVQKENKDIRGFSRVCCLHFLGYFQH